MKKIAILACLLGLCCAAACAPLQRGMDGAVYVSSAKPAFSVAVPDLPLRTAGVLTAAVTSDDSLGGVPVRAWMAVYGGNTLEQPMAIVAQAEVAEPWYWDSDLSRVFSVDKGTAVLGDRLFQACTYIVQGDNDAFTPLVRHADDTPVRWIVRRLASRTDFDQGKITLEYRESLPTDYVSLVSLPHGGNTFLRNFAQRAEKAFQFASLPIRLGKVSSQYTEGIRVRYLNANFFGTMSRHDIPD